MPSTMESVSIVTQAVRTLLATIVVGALGVAGWFGYDFMQSSGLEARRAAAALAKANQELEEAKTQIVSLENTVEEQLAEIDRLDTAMRLLKVDHRIARLTVLEQTADGNPQQVTSLVEFQELNQNGAPIGEARQFAIPGDVVYLDSWLVKFDDEYIEQADLHRSTSLVLFRRLFGENQKPSDGFMLDEFGSRPAAYGRGGKATDFERQIWGDFWSVANDKQRQEDLGIRAAHGEAPSIKVEEGRSYRVDLRASGGLTVVPEGETPPAPKPAA